jgi:hypothetical protein
MSLLSVVIISMMSSFVLHSQYTLYQGELSSPYLGIRVGDCAFHSDHPGQAGFASGEFLC